MKGKSFSTLLVSFFIFFMILSTTVVAQGGGPGGPGGGGVGDPACDPLCNCYRDPPYAPCPIDSYLYILLGVGLIYGIWKVRKRMNVEQ